MPTPLINTLGGPHGFGEEYLSRNDDHYTSAIDITSIFPNGLNFYGEIYDSLYINNNGNVTFDRGLYSYTPGSIDGGISNPIIAPFWADVDTRVSGTIPDDQVVVTPTAEGNSKGTNLVWYDLDEATQTLTVTWDDVGYFNENSDKLNAFQLQLVNQGNGNFDIVYIYEDINWVTGDASGGNDGLGGSVARAGFSAGDGQNYYEFYFSGNENFMLSLEDTQLAGSTQQGHWKFSVESGNIVGIGQENVDDLLEGSSRNDIMDGRSGNDTLYGHDGDDTIAGGDNDDNLFGGAGNDYLIGGNGNNRLDGGEGQDSALYAGIRNTLDIQRNDDGTYTVDAELFEDILSQIEFIAFDDGRMEIDYAVQVRDNQEEFGRFYQALFGRNPDIEGLTYWVNDLVNGNTIQGAAQAFTESDEFANLYGNTVSNADFVELLYQNILGRSSDASGYQYWFDEINQTGNRGGMIVSFANSQEYIGQTQEQIDEFLSSVPLDGYLLIS